MASIRAAIIGGGVAGLGLLRGLWRHGVPVTMYERADGYAERGFGFILLGNGAAALRGLGLDQDPHAFGQTLEHARIETIHGELLANEVLEGAVAVSRHDLLSAIRADMPQGLIAFARAFHSFDWQGSRAVCARLEDGTQIEADAFIGSDGVRSRCRESMEPSHAWRPGRVKEIVSAAQVPDLAQALGTTFRKFMHPDGGLAVGLVPSGRGRVIWFVQFDSERFGAPGAGEAPAFFRERLADFPAMVQQAIHATDPSAPHVWHTVDMDPPPSMVRGNVALIGDAAHPLLPFTSQGANSALEDAALLAAALETCANEAQVEAAFARYNAARHAVMMRYVEAGRAIAANFVQPISGHVPLPLVT